MDNINIDNTYSIKYNEKNSDEKLSIFVQNMWLTPLVSKDKDERFQKICEIIKDEEYDVIVLLEVWNEKYRNIMIKKSLSTKYNNYYFSNGIGVYGSGINGNGIIIFSKFDIIKCKYHSYLINGIPHKFQHMDYYGGKGVGYLELSLLNQNIDLYVTHTHASYSKDCKDYYACRTSQIYEFCEFVKDTHKNDLAIILGDFNTQEGELPYKLLFCELKELQDSWLVCNGECNTITQSTYSSPDNTYSYEQPQRLDYIFYLSNNKSKMKWFSKSCDIIKYYTQSGKSLSDHFGLCTVFDIKENKNNDNLNPDLNKFEWYEDIEKCIVYEEVYQTIEYELHENKKTRIINYIIGFMLYFISTNIILFMSNHIPKIFTLLSLITFSMSTYIIYYTTYILSDNICNYKEMLNEMIRNYNMDNKLKGKYIYIVFNK